MERMHYYQQRIQASLSERIERNPRYSLRAFAKILGLQPSALSQIISGKRFPSSKLASRLFSVLNLSPLEEQEFLKSLAQAKVGAGLKRVSPQLRNLLSQKAVPAATKDISLDLFRTMAEWYSSAILELTYLKGFKSDAQWIATQLGITVLEASTAIQRMLELELLQLVDGRLQKTNEQLVTADRHLTTKAHKNRQKKILEKSIDSLQNDPIAKRNHTAMTFAINSKKIPEAKARIEKFMNEMTLFLEEGEQDHVYEMTVNLFPLQKLNLGEKS
jgi:uncharacterized protein (TIGR02147 family)